MPSEATAAERAALRAAMRAECEAIIAAYGRAVMDCTEVPTDEDPPIPWRAMQILEQLDVIEGRAAPEATPVSVPRRRRAKRTAHPTLPGTETDHA